MEENSPLRLAETTFWVRCPFVFFESPPVSLGMAMDGDLGYSRDFWKSDKFVGGEISPELLCSVLETKHLFRCVF